MIKISEIAASRPVADHSIEQFLMDAESMEAQALRVGPFLKDHRVFFLGDDDHMSPVLADRYGVAPVVYEYDGRIRENLAVWFGKLSVENSLVKEYDAREPIIIDKQCDSFYINPPYSSKSEGLGIKVWLMRALEACKTDCHGVLVMPWNGGNIEEPWVGEVQQSVDAFIIANGMTIVGINENISRYADTTQPNLMSSNIYLSRIAPSRSLAIDPAGLYN